MSFQWHSSQPVASLLVCTIYRKGARSQKHISINTEIFLLIEEAAADDSVVQEEDNVYVLTTKNFDKFVSEQDIVVGE